MGEALLKTDDCLLVVVDVQEKLVPVVWERDKVVDNVVKLVKFAGIIGLPVVVTEQQKLGPTLEVVSQELSGIDPVSKITFDCFGCEQFRAELDRLGRRTLILTGVESHICVAQTALTGVQERPVQVVSDAVSSRVQHNWLIALERMRGAGVVVTSTEMVIYELLRQAGTDQFKATLPLIK